MREANLVLMPALLGVLLGLLAVGVGAYVARRLLAETRRQARVVLSAARRDADNATKEATVAAQERALALQEESDRRERDLDEREASCETRARKLALDAQELGRREERLSAREAEIERLGERAAELERETARRHEAAGQNLERIAGLTAEQARGELVAGIEHEARREAARLARQIEEDARESAEREAVNLIVQATQRVQLKEPLESTVSFIQLPNDEMKGRIIGKEGRNIRALEMATGIDLIVDDTPRSIWISCFDPLRREIARVSIDRLLEDGRIHPARIEEVVARVSEEIEGIILDKGQEAAFSLGITDVHPKLLRLVGRMRYHTSHGQNLLQHALETGLLAGHMTQELGGRVDVARRAGLLHEVSHVAEDVTEPPALAAAEICAQHREADDVVHAIRSLHADVQPRTLEALLLATANRLSESRPGARKENLAVFIERLRRLETIATRFPGVDRAYAVKAGKDLRVIVDVDRVGDADAWGLSKRIARALERELSYSGQIKVSVVRETRAVRFAL